jgi:hypothetical protein
MRSCCPLIRLLPILALGCGVSSAALAEVRTFDYPVANGAPLGYCDDSGAVCGAELARRWCITEGYDGASNWALAEDAGAVSAHARRSTERGFRSITCSREGNAFRTPTLGSLAHSTVITPNRRSVVTSLDPIEYRITVPGCHQNTPGVFLCESVPDYQHCRSLFRAGKVFGCRAGVAFASGFATPVAAKDGEYDLDLHSSAEATVRAERRGKGKVRGEAEFTIAFAAPTPARGEFCLQRDRYLYYPTGPMGGMAGIEATDACDEPISASFEPDEDDLLQAYDACNMSGAWGQSIAGEMEILVAGLYHMASLDEHGRIKSTGRPARIEARYLTVRAPVSIHCEP